MNSISIIADLESDGERVDKYLSFIFPRTSRSYIQKAIESGNVSVNGNPVSKNYLKK